MYWPHYLILWHNNFQSGFANEILAISDTQQISLNKQNPWLNGKPVLENVGMNEYFNIPWKEMGTTTTPQLKQITQKSVQCEETCFSQNQKRGSTVSQNLKLASLPKVASQEQNDEGAWAIRNTTPVSSQKGWMTTQYCKWISEVFISLYIIW